MDQPLGGGGGGGGAQDVQSANNVSSVQYLFPPVLSLCLRKLPGGCSWRTRPGRKQLTREIW